MVENSRLRSDLNKNIEQLNKEIDAVEADKGLNIETRNRRVSLLQHKLLCRQTRLDLLDGKVIREAFFYPNTF
ncbi:MAG: hypothetical protein KGZ82_10760 [Bacteroidales bacterium]|nr:hypothetical protein [Bacteroidales bacterium]